MQTNERIIYADLHTHTVLSDGKLKPRDMLDEAAKKVRVVAMTDHDFMHPNFPELITYGKTIGLHVLPGVELTAFCPINGINVKTDVLLYCPRDASPITEYSSGVKEMRQVWMGEMVKYLNKEHGWNIDNDEVFRESPSGFLNRRHLRDVMIRHGYVKDHKEGKLYTDTQDVPKKGKDITIDEAIVIGRMSGSIVGFAHPFEALRSTLGDKFNHSTAAGMIRDICKNYQFGTIEANYPSHTEEEVKFCKELSDKYDMIISGGSDFHDKKKDQIGSAGLTEEEFEIFKALLLSKQTGENILP